MTRMMMRMLTLMTLMSLTACDSGLSKEQRAEREEVRYQKAMVEYKAGNLDKAVSMLTDVLRENPGNLSARFLLATLQQERKDCLGAFCNFREFTVLAPAGEKTDMAQRRMALCEEQLARELAKKMNLTDNAAIAKENETARKDLQSSEKSVARLSKDLETAQARIAALERENVRLRRMVSAVGEDEKPTMSRDAVKNILDDDEEDVPSIAANGIDAAKDLVADAEDDQGPKTLDRAEATVSGSARKLSDFGSGMSLGRSKEEKSHEPPHEARPETYVVQEGDTLYKIALRFYGSRNQWKKIREANKATISNDGRVKVGQKITLP